MYHAQNKNGINVAIVGFRHDHILSLIAAINDCGKAKIVACCEEDAQTRKTMRQDKNISIDYDNFDQMLNTIDCDVIAIGDYYLKRGELIIRALQHGKHVISDKPICTSLAQLDHIRELASSKHLCVGCMLDLRSSGRFTALRNTIVSGTIGKVHTISITAQHSLNIDKRPHWYFEPGKHGGTINDIGIHAIDLASWLAKSEPGKILFAHTWNAKASDYPHFKDAAQFIFSLANNVRVFCDVSYLAPDNLSSIAPQYWRVTCHGHKGVIETNAFLNDIKLLVEGSKDIAAVAPEPPQPHQYFKDFLSELNGASQADAITTAAVLSASGWALKAQQIADESIGIQYA